MSPQSEKRSLILASSSPYRKLLLERLGLPFAVHSPAVDESPLPGELPDALVARLADAKALVVARLMPAAVVIGSDQVAVFGGQLVGKPGSTERARQQLASFSGQQVEFLTAVSVRCEELGLHYAATVSTEVRFRELSENEVRRYVARDNPVDCAGSFKSEAAGISLLRALSSSDPTAIIGLPLISTAQALRQAGYTLP